MGGIVIRLILRELIMKRETEYGVAMHSTETSLLYGANL